MTMWPTWKALMRKEKIRMWKSCFDHTINGLLTDIEHLTKVLTMPITYSFPDLTSTGISGLPVSTILECTNQIWKSLRHDSSASISYLTHLMKHTLEEVVTTSIVIPPEFTNGDEAVEELKFKLDLLIKLWERQYKFIVSINLTEGESNE